MPHYTAACDGREIEIMADDMAHAVAEAIRTIEGDRPRQHGDDLKKVDVRGPHGCMGTYAAPHWLPAM